MYDFDGQGGSDLHSVVFVVKVNCGGSIPRLSLLSALFVHMVLSVKVHYYDCSQIDMVCVSARVITC